MPLLNNKKFERHNIPKHLKDTDLVFFCEITGEVFLDYQQFSERIILCNSLVWTCSITGRSDLTFSEARDSEIKSKSMIKEFPLSLRKSSLYLATLTKRTSLIDMTEDVYSYVRNRYFAGETVEANLTDEGWITCRILTVIPPSPKELSGSRNDRRSPNDRHYWPPATLHHYEVETVNAHGVKCVHHVFGSELRRKKASYSREKNHIFLKNYVNRQVDGIWKINDDVIKRYDLRRINFEDIFTGSPPKFPQNAPLKKKENTNEKKTPTPKEPPKKKSKLSTAEKNVVKKAAAKSTGKPKTEKASPRKSKSKPNVSTPKKPIEKRVKENKAKITKNTKKMMENRKRRNEEQMQKLLAEKKRKLEEEKRKKEDEKRKILEHKKEEKKRLLEFLKEWNKIREDLELEDLKELPLAIPVALKSPNECFGQMVMLLEFFNVFGNLLKVKTFFASGITIDLLDEMLTIDYVAGPINDVITLLLLSIFKLQQEEEEDNNVSYDNEMDLKVTNGNNNNWSKMHYGLPICELPMDTATVTEVLRLHLLSSGRRTNEQTTKYKYSYYNCDDPASYFRIQKAHILEALAYNCISTLNVNDKLDILECLTNQILTFTVTRNIIEENIDKLRQAKHDLRIAQAADTRQEKLLTQRIKDNKEARNRGESVNGTEEDDLEELERRDKEWQKRRQSMEKRLMEFSDSSLATQLLPLGADRAYRRYWIFPSIAGLFVEYHDEFTGPCLPRPTPRVDVALLQEKDPLSYVRKLFMEEQDKENIRTSRPINLNSPSKKFLIDNRINGVLNSMSSKEQPEMRPYTCWADENECPVHHARNAAVRWSFYNKLEQLEQLIENLNTRGRRESELKNVLMQDKDRIMENINKCASSTTLNRTLAPQTDFTEKEIIRKTTRSNHVGNYKRKSAYEFPNDVSAFKAMESLLRSMIVEMEAKITAGGLGLLKVYDRDEWIKAIVDNSYDKQCYKITWAQSLTFEENTTTVSQTVKDMASAILQLEQSVEERYLQKPLGEEDNNAIATMDQQLKTRQRWEISLMSCTGLPQLFLHLSTLDASINWKKSALNANCRICRRGADPHLILLCDNCNKGHHLYCLKPKLTRVPKGDWFCNKCQPTTTNDKSDKERERYGKRTYSNVSSSDSEGNENEYCAVNGHNSMYVHPNKSIVEKMQVTSGKCKICKIKGPTIQCSVCNEKYHMDCLIPPLRKAPTVNWSCLQCRRINASKTDDINMMVCEPTRSSRRNTSKAANERITQFVRQLRRHYDSDHAEENGEDGNNSTSTKTRKTRHSLETNYVGELPLDNASLQELLDKVIHHQDAWPFIRPVTRNEAPDYFAVIKRPMDFATIKYKLNMLRYRTNEQLIADSMLVFSNCFMYNHESTEVYQCGMRLRAHFKKLCKELNFNWDVDSSKPITKKIKLDNSLDD